MKSYERVGRYYKNGDFKTFWLLRCWNIYQSKFTKILSHNFMINWFKYFDQKEGKCFNTPHLYTIYTTLEYCNIGDTWYSLKILVNSLNFFLFWFWYICHKIYQNIYLKILKTICFNIPCITKIYKPKRFNSFCE